MFSWSTAAFDKLLDKATSHLLLEPDWPSIIQICDCIRQGDVQPKYAISAIKKRLYTRNPHVTLFALQVLESCVKNCGALVHNEVATKPFMEELRDLIKANTNEAVRDKVLELVQAWAHAFRNDPNYRAVQDTLNLMKMEGYKFPYLKESDAMFSADQAPEWADGDCCHRCRVQFSLVQRKHHCRNCGQIFCQKCSSQNAPIPRFGIEKEVRVCEACFEKLSAASKILTAKVSQKGSGSEQSSPSQTSSVPAGGKSEQELQEEEELQLALALSKSEVETNQRSTRRSWQPASAAQNTATTNATSTPPTADAGELDKVRRKDLADGDPELARYLNRAYWEQRQQQQQQDGGAAVDGLPSRQSPIPSAPTSSGSPYTIPSKNADFSQKVDGIAAEADSQLEEFVSQLRSTLEVFVNRLQSNAARGRPVGNDSYVQSLFLSVSNMHSQLLHHLQQQEDLREYYEGLQDKLAQIRDARAALDALREEHREQLRREADEAERQRQIQMAQKLHIMRQKKQEYLQYQHQLALQRMQEQERELQMRHELQKQYHHGGAGFPNQPPPGMPPPAGMPPHSIGMAPPQQQPPPVSMGAPQEPQMHLPPQLHGGPMPPVPGQMMPPSQGHPIPHQPGMPPPMSTAQGHVMTTQGHTILPPPGHSIPQQHGTPVTIPGQHGVPPQGHTMTPQGQVMPPQGHLSMHSLPPQMPPQQARQPPVHMPVAPPPYRSPTHAAAGAVPYMMGTAPSHAMMGQYGPVSMPGPMGHPMEYQAYSMQQAVPMGVPMMHGMPPQENPASPPQHHRPPTSSPSVESNTGAPPVQEAALISFD
uniref:Hepatocyte growth factor-regulated tyrosine kinase substrate n=1 Tax=Amblyomma aureolatum TaxID=187763 RepID=A0A1E1XHY8_9ACAR